MSNNVEIEEIVEMEFEALKAIYLDDIHIELCDRNTDRCDQHLAYLSVNVFPKTGHNASHQFVRLTLSITVPKAYPNEWPVFEFKNIRGLNEDKIKRIKSDIEIVCNEKTGETMLYDVIERTRDLLTTLNFPNGNRCALCLYEFVVNDEILRNECFHYFHCRCFADYMLSVRNSQTMSLTDVCIQCPVCRKDLKSDDIKSYIDPNQFTLPCLSNEPIEDELLIIEEAKQNIQKFNTIYEKQLKNGGIIDLDNEKYKYFIRISEPTDETLIS